MVKLKEVWPEGVRGCVVSGVFMGEGVEEVRVREVERERVREVVRDMWEEGAVMVSLTWVIRRGEGFVLKQTLDLFPEEA